MRRSSHIFILNISDFYRVFETSIDNGFHLKVIHAIPQIAQHVYGRVVAMNTNNQGKAQKANQGIQKIVSKLAVQSVQVTKVKNAV